MHDFDTQSSVLSQKTRGKTATELETPNVLNKLNTPISRRISLPVIVLILLIVGYVAWIMALHVIRFNRFFYGFDLAFYQQAAWNTTQGRFLEVSATEFSSSLLGTDALFIVALMSPIYALAPSPFTLLAIETIVVALGAVPVFWLARDKLKSEWAGILMVLVYLFNLSVQNANLYELRFRPMVTTFLLFAFYFYEKRRGWLFTLFAVLALLCRPENGLLFIMWGLYGWLTGKHKPVAQPSVPGQIRPQFLLRWQLIIIPVLLGAVWFAVATLWIIPGSTTTGSITLGVNYPGGSPLSAALDLVRDPGKGWAQFFKDTALIGNNSKLLYIPALLLPVLFLPLFSPTVLLMALPPVVLNLLSTRDIQWNAWNYHYQGSVVPWLIIGTIWTLSKVEGRRSKVEGQKKPEVRSKKAEVNNSKSAILNLQSEIEPLHPASLNSPTPDPQPLTPKKASIILVLLATLSLYITVGVLIGGDNNSQVIGRTLTSKEQARWMAGKTLLAQIPADAPLAISNVWAAQVPPRRGLWLFAERVLYSRTPTRDAQFVFADLRKEEDAVLVEKTLRDPAWQKIAEAGDYVLLKRRNVL